MKPTLFLTALLLVSLSLHAQQRTTNFGTQSGDQGDDNTSIGFRAGRLNIDNNNSFFGSLSGENNLDGTNNSFFGFNSGKFNSSGNNNIAVGSNAGRENITGNNNVSIGVNAGRDNNGGINNIAVGWNAGRANTGANNNISIGTNANTANMTGVSNIAVGTNAGSDNVDGNANLYLGFNSGAINIGNRNVFLGTNTGSANINGNGNVFIGNRVGLNELGSNMLYIDNSDTDTPLIFGDFSTNQIGINTNTIPNGIALGVGGDALVDGTLYTNGRLSIGTTEEDPGYAFTVKGKIHAQEVRVDLEGATAPDYVFLDDYDLRDLEDIESYIEEHGHLPNIPSAAEMEEQGVNLKEMNLKLLEKIEELTLYAIQQKKRLENQKELQQSLEERLSKIESLIESK